MATFDETKQNKQLDDLHRTEEEELVAMLAETKFNLPYIDITKVGVDNEALRSIGQTEARENLLAPFKLSGTNVLIAMRSPTPELIEKITAEITPQKLTPIFYMASMNSLNKVWERYEELSMAENTKIGGIDISMDVVNETAKNIHQMADIKKLISESLAENQVHRISRILEVILAGAIAIKASDVHIEPEKDTSRLRIRLDGVLQDVIFLDTNIYKLLSSRIKLLSGVKLNSQTSQDGRFSIMEGEDEINIRTSLIPGAYGETIVMRILDPKATRIDLKEIGIDPFLYQIVEKEIMKPNGMILVTGPTGSGKTTTLYAFLSKIYSTEINIITIEDPIEYHLDGITQTQTNEKKDYTFAEGLRSALRQDPDVIMVGEIRDADTAKTAVQASLTGHLVLSTLHTNNAAGTIPRLIDLEVNPKILVSAISLSLAQRLVRKLCPVCKQETAPTEEQTKTIQMVLESIKAEGKDLKNYNIDASAPIKMFKAVGCDRCNMTGYTGRIGIFEAIKTDEAIEKLILENPSEHEVKKAARAQGILSMRQDGIVKIITGVTSMEEVQSVVDLNEE